MSHIDAKVCAAPHSSKKIYQPSFLIILVILLVSKKRFKLMKLFITGTDTGVGKTYTSIQLLQAFNKQGLSTLGIKPVSSGCIKQDGHFYNEDALILQKASSIKLPYEKINPFAFEPAIAPHIAADQIGCALNVAMLKQKTQHALNYPADICLVEGVGGWSVPLNDNETMADFVVAQDLSIILVIGIRLGCLNHALLTYNAIKQSGAKIMGWIGNHIDTQMEYQNENIHTLKKWLPISCLGTTPYQCPLDLISEIKF